MTLHRISGCKALDFNIIGNLQFELVSTKSTVLRSLKLDQLGPKLDETAECWTFTVEDGERVASMDASYENNYIEYVAVTLSTGRYTRWGA